MRDMRAAIYRSIGDAHDVFEIVDLEEPEPGPGEVRVRIHLSAVNPTDWKARRGSRGPTLPWPYVVPNQDGAGVIDAVGPGVDESRLGERVWVWFAAAGRQHGTAAEWVAVPQHLAVPLPDSASLELGACLGVPAMTAHRALFWDGPIAGQNVLVSGGAGAVGHFTVELARRAGATVIATVSSDEKGELARQAGAHAVVNYRAHDAVDQIRAAAPAGVDRVVEVALGENLELDLAVVGEGATIVSYAATPDDPTVPVLRLMRGNVTLRFMLLYGVPEVALRDAVSHITQALSEDALTPLPIIHFPLDGIADAHDACEQGALGKVVVDLA